MAKKYLQQAREFEKEHIKMISPGERPAYHVSAGTGWLNDPNGFSYYKGEYHLFYQYHPYSNEWGPMHWGHVKSSDLIKWERLPVAMAPDQDYDKDGCFSGSALELSDGRHLLMYTGVQVKEYEDGTREQFQTQCIAFGDGVNYEKYAGNPVITGKDLPKGGLKADFRDPKIWQEDGTFYAVMSDMMEDGNGAILLYESPDALNWKLCGEIDSSHGELGNMWECPDYFALDGRQVLLVSPMAMKPQKDKFHVGHGTVYILGSYNKTTHRFTREDAQPLDWGIDFYAPQTTMTPDGRRVMIAWMQAWTNSKFVPDGVKYFGQLCVPRELSIRDGKLIQTPVRELEKYRGEAVRYEELQISDKVSLDGIRGRVLDMTLEIQASEELLSFCMEVASDEEYGTSISYEPGSGTLCVDRSRSGYLYDIVHSRAIKVRTVDGCLKLRILLDRYSMEIFVNDGEQTASFTLYTRQSADGITFAADGNAKISIEKYALMPDETEVLG